MKLQADKTINTLKEITMKRSTLYVVIIIMIFCSVNILSAEESSLSNTTLRIMTFNIWENGKAGEQPLSQTAEVIKASKADIVGIQEIGENVKPLVDLLGWYHVHHRYGAILSRFEIIEVTENEYGVKIRLDSKQEVFVFNVHFRSAPYQPYQLLNIPYGKHAFIKTEKEAIAAAQKARGDQVTALLKEIDAVKGKNIPIFVTGDFNEPSHLDWTKATAKEKRHPIKVSFPSSLALVEAGFADAYRTIYPDEVKMPGYTWTPLTKTSDPKDHHDRIDFVYFSGKGVEAKSVEIIGENKTKADLVVAPYPSDHRAMVASFSIAKDSTRKR